jgi:integrase
MKDARKRNGIWHADFSLDGERYRQSLDTTDWREASRKVAEMVDLAKQGKLTPESREFSRLGFSDAIERWFQDAKPRLSPKTYYTEHERALNTKKFFGQTRLKEITVERINAYMRQRAEAGISGATINREIDAVRAVLKRARLWHRVADDVKPFPKREPIGRALTADEKARLVKMARRRPEWQVARLAMTLSLNTTMRGCEIRGLRWRDIDFLGRSLTVRRATTKTDAGERLIPLNTAAVAAIMELRERAKLFGAEPKADWYVFPADEGQGPVSTLNGATVKPDPTKPMRTWRTAWRGLTRAIECPSCGELQKPGKVCPKCHADIHGITSPLAGLRFHDMRHHCITELAEGQGSDETIMSIAGHVSRKMLSHYSHIRMAAKRRAVDALATGTFGDGSVTNHVTKSPTDASMTEQVFKNVGGRQGIRTPDPRVANAMLSQLS